MRLRRTSFAAAVTSVALIVSTLVIAPLAHADQKLIYVNGSGSDETGTGSSTKPFKTLDKALKQDTSSQLTVTVQNRLPKQTVTNVSRSGIATVTGDATLEGLDLTDVANVSFEHLTFTKDGPSLQRVNHISFDHVLFKDFDRDGLFGRAVEFFRFTNSTITNTNVATTCVADPSKPGEEPCIDGSALMFDHESGYVDNHDLYVANNLIQHVRSGDGFQIQRGTNVTLSHNQFLDITHPKGTTVHADSMHITGPDHNITLDGNRIGEGARGPMIINPRGDGSNPQPGPHYGLVVTNNVIEGREQNLQIANAAPGAVIAHNTFIGSSFVSISNGASNETDSSHDVVLLNNIIPVLRTNPGVKYATRAGNLVADASADAVWSPLDTVGVAEFKAVGDYHLTATSKAVNTGSTLLKTRFTTDIDGKTRDNKPDVGAAELNGSAPASTTTTTTAAPTTTTTTLVTTTTTIPPTTTTTIPTTTTTSITLPSTTTSTTAPHHWTLAAEAEDFTGGRVAKQTDSSNGKVKQLWNDESTATRTFQMERLRSVQIVARGTECNNVGTELELSIDGKVVSKQVVTKHPSTYTFPANALAGSHTVSMRMASTSTSSCDRQLFIDTVTFS